MNFDLIGIAIIIFGTIFSVHYVYQKAYKMGREAGIHEGRLQVLKEELVRSEMQTSIDLQLKEAIELASKTKYDNLKSQIKESRSIH